MDTAAVESRVMDRAMQKFSEEYKRKMNVEDTHTVHNYEPVHALVRKLELEMVALKKGKRG